MNDPAVVALFYRFKSEDNTVYVNPTDVAHEVNAFRLNLSKGLVTVQMKVDCSTEQSARAQVEPFLKAWETSAALSEGRKVITFEFQRSKIVDRSPDPAGQTKLRPLAGILSATGSLVGCLQVSKTHYPEPPKDFVMCPDVETMWRRYSGYQEGREPLSSMAYLCLTILEMNAGDRRRSALQYGFDHTVLSKLGYLCSEVGDEQTARKRSNQSQNRSYTPAEKSWMEAVIRAMIRRVGEFTHDPTRAFKPLTMSDFPPL